MNLKYLKTFESFENGTQNVEEIVKQKIESLSPDQKEELSSQLFDLSVKLGLSPEEMTDTEKVAAALAKKQGSLKLESLEVNEGFKDWWSRVKNKFYSWLTKIGIGGIIGSIASVAIGAEMQSHETYLADFVPDATVNPNTAVIIGGLAFVISMAAFIIGLDKSENK
mgnify:CR=1 FL=1